MPKKNKKPDWNSQAKTALILKVSKQAVQKRCKPGGDLHEATNEKKQVNLWHPKIQAWKAEIEEKQTETQGPAPEKKTKKKDDPQRHVNFSTEVSFEDVENLTIKEVVERYGGISGLMNYVKAMKEISDWKTKEDKRRKNRNELIEKATVAKSLFTLFDVAFRRIVSEYPGTVTDQLFALAKSKKKTRRIDAITLQENTLSQILKGVKSEVIKGLDGSES
jgi:hypothetical protein